MTGCGAEFEHLQPPAKQIDVIDGLRAPITAVQHAGGKYVGAILFTAILLANADVFRPQRDAYFCAGLNRMQQRRLPPPSFAKVDHPEFAVAFDKDTGELVGSARKV